MEVVVGRVGRPHGLRGEVSIHVRTDEPEHRFAPGAMLRPEPSTMETLTVSAVRPHGARLLVSFHEIGDRAGAELLRGAVLMAQLADDARPDNPEEFYDSQLVGLVVRTSDGCRVGEVRDVLHLPTQEVLVVATDEGQEALVPFVAALVPTVDLPAGSLTVVAQPGLLSDDVG